MRKVLFVTDRHTRAVCIDQPDPVGGGCHEYMVVDADDSKTQLQPFASIRFQRGPIGENGVNGCHNEDLIGIVIDRLDGFQRGDFACRENELAISYLQQALHQLNMRTKDRSRRGVEGTHKK